STSRNRSSITSLTFQGIALQLALNLLPMCLETSVTYVVGSYHPSASGVEAGSATSPRSSKQILPIAYGL
ncbi:MAG: hypothetical protein ACLQBJ_16695, partial [Bryobacteraceae bacterium]